MRVSPVWGWTSRDTAECSIRSIRSEPSCSITKTRRAIWAGWWGESLEKDVRQADEIRDTSNKSSLEIWLDADSDDILRSGEVVVWSFETAPTGGSNLVRTVTDTGERWVAAEGLVTPGGGYDPFTDGTAAPDSSTTLLTVTLHAAAVPGVGEIETITTRIHLRNK